ncbi:MAG: hypothetical protein KF678_02650 [Phycisphaeraceae bacterium]|nr:hypothetical protein [Phycisphaeraceae bacterium]
MPRLFGHVLYPDRYAWYVLVSALDIMITVTVLVHLGMREANTFAQWSINQFGTWGLIGLKFLSVILVVLICEYIGRRDVTRGRRLTVVAIAVSVFPVTAALVQVAYLAVWGDVYWEQWPPPPHP